MLYFTAVLNLKLLVCRFPSVRHAATVSQQKSVQLRKTLWCCFVLRCSLLQFSTLVCWFVFVFKSFYYVLFDAKRTKNFCTRKVYSQVLFVHAASDHSVKHLLVMATHGLFAGCCETRSTRVFEKIYTRVALRQSRTMACKPHRLPLNTLTVQVSPLATSYPCC